MDDAELAILLAREASILATECSAALAELGLLFPARSESIETTLRRIADLSRKTGGQVPETFFLHRADDIARWRDELPPPDNKRGPR